MNLRKAGNLQKTSLRQHGFSMFELMVYILVAAILFANILNRYRDYPMEAERANVLAVLSQLKVGVNLQMMNAIATGTWNEIDSFDGSNPMDLMLQTPSNYIGIFGEVDVSQLPRRVWYFDTTLGELVYLAENSDNLVLLQGAERIPSDQIRFRVKSVYREVQGSSRPEWQGLVLEPVLPYEWQRVPLELDPALQGNAG